MTLMRSLLSVAGLGSSFQTTRRLDTLYYSRGIVQSKGRSHLGSIAGSTERDGKDYLVVVWVPVLFTLLAWLNTLVRPWDVRH